jgi:hypothetical protein
LTVECRGCRKTPICPDLIGSTQPEAGKPHPSPLRRTWKVEGKSPSAVRPVDEPFGHELKAEWLGAERAEGENCLKSLVFVSNLESCALSPVPFAYAILRSKSMAGP